AAAEGSHRTSHERVELRRSWSAGLRNCARQEDYLVTTVGNPLETTGDVNGHRRGPGGARLAGAVARRGADHVPGRRNGGGGALWRERQRATAPGAGPRAAAGCGDSEERGGAPRSEGRGAAGNAGRRHGGSRHGVGRHASTSSHALHAAFVHAIGAATSDRTLRKPQAL